LPAPIWSTWRLADCKTRAPREFVEALALFFAEYDPSGAGDQPSLAFLRHGARIFAAAGRGSADKALGLVRNVSGTRPLDLYKVAAVVRAIDDAKSDGKKLSLKQAMRQLNYRGSASSLRSTMTKRRARIAEINTPYDVSRSVEALAKMRAGGKRIGWGTRIRT
jgi:hypothetical protein